MNDKERSVYLYKNFLCQCGMSLELRVSRDSTNRAQHYRIACSNWMTHNYPEGHDEPTPWSSSREEAFQLWSVIRVLTK